MTPIAAQKLVEQIRFCGAFRGVTMSLERAVGEDSVALSMGWRVPDRDAPDVLPEHVTVHFRSHIAMLAFDRFDHIGFVNWVRAAFREFVLHEADEAFLVDGVRLFDPHRTKEVRPCPNPDVPVRTDDEPPGSTAPGGSCPDGAVRS